MSERKKLPTLLQMAKNFTKDLAANLKDGFPIVTQEQYEERLETCRTCDDYLEEARRCGKCGCYLEYKARMRASTCPMTPTKWKILDPTLTEYEKDKHTERLLDFCNKNNIPEENCTEEGVKEWHELLYSKKNNAEEE